MTRRERMQRRRRNRGGPAQMLFLGLGVVSTVLVLSAIGVVMYVVAVASSGPSLQSLQPQVAGSTSTVYDADGKRLGFIRANILRTPVQATEIPEVMRQATVAIEDRRFFRHRGVDFEGVVRAAIRNIGSGETVEGGSTLTMQLIRNLYTGERERTFKRKLREARLAEELENDHPGREGKLWILNQYINNVPYGTSGGQSAVGVQAAARIFFNKPASELTLPEAALLAGLPQAPTTYNPITNPTAAKSRRDKVLRTMAEQNMISGSEAQAAINSPLGAQEGKYYRQRTEGYFFDYVQQELIDEYGPATVSRGGMVVHTTLDRGLQRAARAALTPTVAGTNRAAAVVSVDPRNGEIRAMASSGRYGQFKFNLATQGGFAAGSTFKTMVLIAALRRGIDPASTYYVSRPLNFTLAPWGKIDVTTYDNTYIGRANLVTATLRSDNSIYQQLDLDVGPQRVRRTARDMGITSTLLGIPAEGLGGLRNGVSPLQMANAYATIASYGYRNKPTALRRVCLPKDTDGALDCRDVAPERKRVFSDGVAAKATEILKQNITSGTGTAANIGCPAAGKTGTVDDFTDAWFVGYTPRLATAVWVGHANVRTTLGPGAAGGTLAAPIWGTYMRTARRGYCGDWPAPNNPFQGRPFVSRFSQTGLPYTPPAPTQTQAQPQQQAQPQPQNQTQGGVQSSPGARPQGTPPTQTPGTGGAGPTP